MNRDPFAAAFLVWFVVVLLWLGFLVWAGITLVSWVVTK